MQTQTLAISEEWRCGEQIILLCVSVSICIVAVTGTHNIILEHYIFEI